MSYIFQNAEEGLNINTSQAKYIAGETSKVTVDSLMLSDRYWEQVVSTVDAEGEKQMYYIIFVKVRISEDEFKKAINNALENDVYIDRKYIGKTPLKNELIVHKDRNNIVLKKESYKKWSIELSPRVRKKYIIQWLK